MLLLTRPYGKEEEMAGTKKGRGDEESSFWQFAFDDGDESAALLSLRSSMTWTQVTISWLEFIRPRPSLTR